MTRASANSARRSPRALRFAPGEQIRLLIAQFHRTALVMQTAAILGAGYIAVDRHSRHVSIEERARRMDAQHRASAERLARLAGRLRGLLTKTGQYLSARPDLLPEPYIASLAGLQDAVPPKPYRLIARQIERELGAPVETLFARFDRRPLASASLSLVHRAILPDGREVAVKVQYPGIEALVRADLRNLGLIVGVVGRIWPRYDFRPLYREVQRLVPIELDFHREAANAERIGREMSGRDDVFIPSIVREYSARRVLTMSFVDGFRIGDLEGLRAAGLDPPRLALQLVDIFGEQVIAHGFFHGDPHPGNILVRPDGRVALIDFGQALALDSAGRHAFSQLSAAAADRNPAGMLEAVRSLGFGLPKELDSAYLQMASQVLGTLSPDGMVTSSDDDAATVNIQMARSFRRISLDGVRGETLFVFRVQGLLRGLRTRLGSPGPVILAWEPYASRFLLTAEAAPAPPSD